MNYPPEIVSHYVTALAPSALCSYSFVYMAVRLCSFTFVYLSAPSGVLCSQTQPVHVVYASFLQGLADGPPSAVQSSHIKIIRICSTSSYTFAKIQAKDIHGVTQPWSALYSPSLTRARAVPHMHTDAKASSPYAHPRSYAMLGSRGLLRKEEPYLSP